MKQEDFRQKAAHVPVAREGLPFILSGVFITFTCALSGWAIATILFLALTLLVLHFFRDPERVVTAEASEVLSPADGRVIAIDKTREPQFTGRPCWKVSIFMSVFNVHVNRIPISGVIEGLRYRKGRFWAASTEKADRENEQSWIWIRGESGEDVVVTQVAGLIARRIVCWPSVGDRVVRGERFGLIRLGSRLDVYVPETIDLLVSKGDRVTAGESVLCRMK
ncbi:MAG: phosphatidylserine decarboxylase family protein [Thermodesulfobacteriota bacterium]|nr:phosphatidylserine decarboxylase family protein [Thermodesulfobacteriota bacterium]